MGSGPAELVSLAELNFLGTAGSGQRGTVVSGVDLRDIRDMGPTWKENAEHSQWNWWPALRVRRGGGPRLAGRRGRGL